MAAAIPYIVSLGNVPDRPSGPLNSFGPAGHATWVYEPLSVGSDAMADVPVVSWRGTGLGPHPNPP